MEKKEYLQEERKAILFQVDSILRWDKVNLSWFQVKAWALVRFLVNNLTRIKY